MSTKKVNLSRLYILTTKNKNALEPLYYGKLSTTLGVLCLVGDRKQATEFKYVDAVIYKNNKNKQSEIAQTFDWDIA